MARKIYYSIGFTDEELQEIETAYKEQTYGTSAESSFYSKRTNFIKQLIFSGIDLEKDNQRLKSIVRETRARPAAIGQSDTDEETTWTGYFRNIKNDGNILYPEWG